MLDEYYSRAERLVGAILWKYMAHPKLEWHHFLASNLEDYLYVVSFMDSGLPTAGMHTDLSFIDLSSHW